MRIKLTSSLGPAIVKTFNDDASVADIVSEAGMTFSIPTNEVRLATGVPIPKDIDVGSVDTKAVSVGIKNGVIVEVRRVKEHVIAPVAQPNAGAAASPMPQPAAMADGPWQCAACTFLNENASAPGCEMCGTERPPPLSRHVVPADNTCLFTAVGYCADGQRMDRGMHYRHTVADAIRLNAKELELGEGELGKSPAEYAAYISGKDTWGGGLELAVLAKLLRTEICAIEIRTGRPYTFGEGKGYKNRIYLVFDGVHYDALHRVHSSGDGSASGPAASGGHAAAATGRVTTVFSVDDDSAKAGALEVAAKLRAARDFVDLTGFTIRCGVCFVGLKGEAEAVEHARKTGHTNFSEYK